MKFPLFDSLLSVLIIAFIIGDYVYQLTTIIIGLEMVLMLGIFIIYLVWATILVYNLSSISVDYAFPDETHVSSGMRQKKLFRTIILVVGVCSLLFGTIIFITIPAIIFCINLAGLRAGFLLLGPDENPFYMIASPKEKERP